MCYLKVSSGSINIHYNDSNNDCAASTAFNANDVCFTASWAVSIAQSNRSTASETFLNNYCSETCRSFVMNSTECDVS